VQKFHLADNWFDPEFDGETTWHDTKIGVKADPQSIALENEIAIKALGNYTNVLSILQDKYGLFHF
jgi:hypothetical protein